MRSPRIGPIPVVTLMLVLAACTTTEPSEPSETTAAPTPDQTGITSTTTTDGAGNSQSTGAMRGPLDAAAEIRPDLIRVDPVQPRAGDSVSIFFPDERIRGIHFVLESSGSDGWNLEYHLISDWGDGRDPKVYRADAVEGIGFEDIGIGGGGPDVVLIPAEVLPGDYRVCTGNSRPNICAPLTIDPAA